MKKSEFKTIVEELIKEINHTQDSSGKSIVAQGAPGSVIRFVTENPELIKQMRDWVKDCEWSDIGDESDVDELSDMEILKGIQRNYDGGIKEFIAGDQNSKAQVPVGYKEGTGYRSEMHPGYPDKGYKKKPLRNPKRPADHPDNAHDQLDDEPEGAADPESSAFDWKKFGSSKPVPGDYREGYGMGDMSKDPKKAFKGARWTVKFDETQKMKLSEVKSVIRELIAEMWVGYEEKKQNVAEGPSNIKSPDGIDIYMKMLDIANLDDPSYRLISAVKRAITDRVKSPIELKELQAVFNKEFGSGIHELAWDYYGRPEELREVTEGGGNYVGQAIIQRETMGLANTPYLLRYWAKESNSKEFTPEQRLPIANVDAGKRFVKGLERARGGKIKLDIQLENMTPKQQLQALIREAINEVEFEEPKDHEHEEQQELIALKRIQSYAHWAFKNFEGKLNEIPVVLDKIVGEIDELVNAHEKGREIPAESVNENTEDESEEIKALKLIVMYASKAKSVQDPALKQRTLVTIEAMANKILGKNEPVGSPLDKYRESK